MIHESLPLPYLLLLLRTIISFPPFLVLQDLSINGLLPESHLSSDVHTLTGQMLRRHKTQNLRLWCKSPHRTRDSATKEGAGQAEPRLTHTVLVLHLLLEIRDERSCQEDRINS